jgi:hypothetical protein
MGVMYQKIANNASKRLLCPDKKKAASSKGMAASR